VSASLGADSVGLRIAEARRAAGLNQKGFAQRIGTTLWMLDRIEAGAADAAAYIPSIADATGRPQGWFSANATAAVATMPVPRVPLVARLRTHVTTGRDLVLASISLLVLIRFFTEVAPVIPRAANFIDIPIFLVLSAAALTRSPPKTRTLSFAAAGGLFLFVSLVSVSMNYSQVAVGPVLVFLYGFLAPIGVAAAAYRVWPGGHALSLSRLLVALGVVQLIVVAAVDLPRFISSGNPDLVSGTFGTNAYQLVFFLLLLTALLAGIFTFERQRLSARFALPLFAAILATIFLAQYRALLVTTALTVLFIGLLLGARGRGIVAVTVVAASFGVSLAYVAQHFPLLRFGATLSVLRHNPSFYVSKRLKAADSVVNLYDDNPRFIFTGTGPGTFSSRAWQTFANVNSTSRSNVQGRYITAISGGGAYHTDVSDKYVVPLERAPAISGTRALTSPFSSYVSLLAEVGVVGFAAMVGIYLAATGYAIRMAVRRVKTAKPGDPLPALMIAAAAGFFILLQMGFLDNWLEVTRVTFVVWMLLGVASKELAHEVETTA
jgi:transcriptional regulator with XRE-family HTH domain